MAKSLEALEEAEAMKQVRAAMQAVQRVKSLNLNKISSMSAIATLSNFQDDLTYVRDSVAVRVCAAPLEETNSASSGKKQTRCMIR